MEESRTRKIMERVWEYMRTSYARKIIMYTVSFSVGLLCSRGAVFGKYAPFGVAAVAAVPKAGLWAAVGGAVFGYLIPSAAYVPARYIAALCAAAAIRWSMSELRTVNTHPLFAPMVTFLPLLLTGMTMVFINGSLNYTAAMYVAEAFLGSGCTYFLNRTSLLLTDRRESALFQAADVASLTVTAAVIVLSFSGVSFAGVSLGRILMILMVIYCARVGGISGGTIAGVTAGVIQGLSTAGLSYLSGAYGLGGLMAGVFAPMGKVMTAVAFIISHGVASLQVGDNSQVMTGVFEVAAATVIYMAAPRSQWVARLFGVRKENLSGGALRSNMIMRLRHSSGALTGVCASLEEISKKLSSICAPDIQGVYNKATETVCAGCSMSTVCWRKNKDQMLESFSELTPVLKENGKVESSDFKKELADRCGRLGELREAINKNYTRHLMREAAEMRTAQVREVVESHFTTTADILEEMAEEFSQYQQFDEEAAERVEDILRESGITPIEVCCRIDRFGRMTVEALVERERQKRINRATFTREVSSACGRSFSPPCVSNTDDKCRLQMCQRPVYEVDRGFAQYSAGGGAFCGDSVNVFYDGCGRFISVLSDGMGVGGRAAVDGVMASTIAETLIKAGVGFDSMLNTVNSAMLAKSGDESLATVDLVCIDLFTGKAEFKKAGAACTLLRKGKKTELIEVPSMPVGILPSVKFASLNRELSQGDMVIMVSDGIAASGTEWLLDYVSNFNEEENLNVIADRIAQEAQKRRSDGREDDMTVLILSIR